MQTYIWHADLTGLFLAQQLLEAADRGVKVRLLLDDMDARAKNAGLRRAGRAPEHRRCACSIPSRRAGACCGMIGEGLTNFERINRRMHNKTWIADNRIAIVGGRNLGDEYFGASDEVNFVDLDFAMVGPIVRDASASFDRYWNSPSAYPMELLDPDGVSAAALEKPARTAGRTRAREADDSRYAAALRAGRRGAAPRRRRLADAVDRDLPFVADDPLKVTMTGAGRAALRRSAPRCCRCVAGHADRARRSSRPTSCPAKRPPMPCVAASGPASACAC